mgnify:CR=1 FL=1
MRVKIYCDSCKSQSDVVHEMDSYQYNVSYCPLCGSEVDEDEIDAEREPDRDGGDSSV